MTFRAMMLQGRLALHLEPDLLDLDLEHCDHLVNQFVEHANQKRDMGSRGDRNIELLATADDVYEHILQGEPGRAIKMIMATVPWIQTEDPLALALLKKQHLVSILRQSSDREALEFVRNDLTPFITKHFSHEFLRDAVALLIGGADSKPTSTSAQQDPCSEAATVSLATRVAGVIRLQAVTAMPLLRFVVAALALLDERNAQQSQSDTGTDRATDTPLTRNPGLRNASAMDASAAFAARAHAASTPPLPPPPPPPPPPPEEDAAKDKDAPSACPATGPRERSGSPSAAAAQDAAVGGQGAPETAQPSRGRKRDSRGRLLPRALLREPARLSDFPDLDSREGEAICKVTDAQCVASLVGASDEETISCTEALAGDTARALRWQLLRAPVDERLLCDLVREYCTVRGLSCGALEEPEEAGGAVDARGADVGGGSGVATGSACDGDVVMGTLDSPRDSGDMAAPDAMSTDTVGPAGGWRIPPFRRWISQMEAAVACSDVAAVESLVGERAAARRRDAASCATAAPDGGARCGTGGAACGADVPGGGGLMGGPACKEDRWDLPVELQFKLQRLKVLAALRRGDLAEAQLMAALHLGPLVAQQPALQATLSETMQLFMHDEGRAEAEAAAQADLRKHLRAHFASGDAAATGACGLVSVLQRGLCAYATWYSAVSKITASKEPCGGLLQLNRLVKRIHAWPREGHPGGGGASARSHASEVDPVSPPDASPGLLPAGEATVAGRPSPRSTAASIGGADAAPRRPTVSRSERLRVEAMQGLLSEIFRVTPDDAAAAAAIPAIDGGGGWAARAGGAGGAETPRGRSQFVTDVEAMIEMIRAEEGVNEDDDDGGSGGVDAEDSEEEEEEDGEEDDEEDEEEEDDDEDNGTGAGEDAAEEGPEPELNMQESVDRLVEITNIPNAYARVLLEAHDGDLAAAISTVMDVI